MSPSFSTVTAFSQSADRVTDALGADLERPAPLGAESGGWK